MNWLKNNSNREAKIAYLDGDMEVIESGSFVTCAMTGVQIPVDELKYWSVARQEPYVDAAASLEAEKRAGNLPNQKRA
jgi:hypothetical protein